MFADQHPPARMMQVPARMPTSTSAPSEPPQEIAAPTPAVRPTFPAYSAPSGISDPTAASTTAVTSASTPVRKIEFAASSSSKLIHPDDDISLVTYTWLVS